MKTNAIVRIILFSIIILILLSILGVSIAADRFMFRRDFDSNATTSSSGTADADEIRNLSIEWAAGTITIRPADVTAITLTETCGEQDDPMVWLQSGDTLKVSSIQDTSFFYVGNIPAKDLLIEVPMDWSCVSLEIDTAAADLIVESMTIEKVDFDGASGKFTFTDCIVDSIELDTASGDISYTGCLESLDCDAASADCDIILNNCPRFIEMDMASGDLDLTLPDGCGFNVELEALSGNLNTDFEITHTSNGFTAGDGSCRIDISAMSGDVYIHKSTEARNCDH